MIVTLNFVGFDWDTLCINIFGGITIFETVNFPMPECSISHHLFRSSFLSSNNAV